MLSYYLTMIPEGSQVFWKTWLDLILGTYICTFNLPFYVEKDLEKFTQDA